jgi:hypothetical protein
LMRKYSAGGHNSTDRRPSLDVGYAEACMAGSKANASLELVGQ